jgi:hypothetical protein
MIINHDAKTLRLVNWNDYAVMLQTFHNVPHTLNLHLGLSLAFLVLNLQLPITFSPVLKNLMLENGKVSSQMTLKRAFSASSRLDCSEVSCRQLQRLSVQRILYGGGNRLRNPLECA